MSGEAKKPTATNWGKMVNVKKVRFIHRLNKHIPPIMALMMTIEFMANDANEYDRQPPICSADIKRAKNMTDTRLPKRLIWIKMGELIKLLLSICNRTESNGSFNIIKLKLEAAGKLSFNIIEGCKHKISKAFQLLLFEKKWRKKRSSFEKKKILPYSHIHLRSDVIGLCVYVELCHLSYRSGCDCVIEFIVHFKIRCACVTHVPNSGHVNKSMSRQSTFNRKSIRLCNSFSVRGTDKKKNVIHKQAAKWMRSKSILYHLGLWTGFYEFQQ